MNRRIAARGIIVLDGKVLCARLKNYKYQDASFWSIPGGTLEESEAIEDGLSREIFEELGVKAKIGNLLYVQQYVRKDMETIEFFIHITNPEDFTNIDLTNTSHG